MMKLPHGSSALRRKVARVAVLAAAVLGVGVSLAQFSPFQQRRTGGGEAYSYGPIIRGEGNTMINEDSVRTAREVETHSMGTPNWTNAPGFQKDVFTFARLMFKTAPDTGRRVEGGFGRGWRLGWWVDFPDADLNLSYRLQQLTSMKVDPDCRVVRITDPELTDFPFVFMEHPGYMDLDDEQQRILRNYLLNGGALLVIDFWSQREWDGFERQMKLVLPGRSWVDLPASHPIFHCVYNLNGTLRDQQVPTIQFWNPEHNPKDPQSRIHRVDRGEGDEEVHVRAWLDDKQRIMALAFHNSDISDGWEREGENDEYFKKFSEKIAYPMGINLMVYLMTH
jgi:hypothetical protein